MRLVTLLSVALVVHVSAGFAQILGEVKILSVDGSINWFGSAVAIDGNDAVVGARLDDNLFMNAGAAYVFHYDEYGWAQTQKVYAGDAQAEFRFGRSVAIAGDYFIVGAHTADLNVGAAYIFRRDTTEWLQQAKLTPGNGVPGDFFGTSVDISGDYAVVGAFGKNDSSGSAYVYFRQDTVWTEQAILSPPDLSPDDRFGRSVAIDGDYIIVGAFADDDSGNSSGSAYVFQRSGTVWSQQAKLNAIGGMARDNFGIAVDISGDYAVVGARNVTTTADSSGAAYVFRRTGSSWAQQARLEASDPYDGAEFGVSVGISGPLVLIGARFDQGVNGSGAAYVFERTDSSWFQTYKIVPADADSDYQYGWNVAISNGDAIVGAHQARGNSGRPGAAYIYTDIPLPVVERGDVIPKEFSLAQNHPNPFNPSTTISYTLPAATAVRLTIYDLLGNEIRSMVDRYQAPGEYQVLWNGTNSRGQAVGTGVYLYRFEAGNVVRTRKMMLLK